MIIISDIHGRTFWQQALKNAGALDDEGKLSEDVVFMGDYLDHYDHEYDPNTQSYITADDACVNFLNIIKLKENNPNMVTLLLGNHDMEYISEACPDCRMYVNQREWIKEVFMENLDKFRLGWYLVVNGTIVTLSHANITKHWLYEIESKLNAKGYQYKNNVLNKDIVIEAIDLFNFLVQKCARDKDENDIKLLGECLAHVGYGRGGFNSSGSMVWADLHDYTENDPWDDVYQIVAHTQHYVKVNPDDSPRFVYDKHTFCTDCHVGDIGKRPLFKFIEKHPYVEAVLPI